MEREWIHSPRQMAPRTAESRLSFSNTGSRKPILTPAMAAAQIARRVQEIFPRLSNGDKWLETLQTDYRGDRSPMRSRGCI